MKRHTISLDKRVLKMILEKRHEMEVELVKPVSVNDALVALMYDLEMGVKKLPEDIKKQYIYRTKKVDLPP